MNFRDLAQSCYRYQVMINIKNIYNQFNPFNPLPANYPAYVNCSEVRGYDNIFKEISKLNTSLRRIPSTRETIRKQVDNHSVSLIAALNEFIEDAQKKCQKHNQK